MPFDSNDYKNFAKEWNFKIITSIPPYSQSNGLAEKGVGIAKKMLKKCLYNESDCQLYLLNYRSTPVANLGVSPAELMMSRNIRTKIPIHDNFLIPKIVNRKDKMIENQNKQKEFYNSKARAKDIEFSENEKIMAWDINRKIWEKATVIKQLHEPRSYLIKNLNGNIIRRNIKYLTKGKPSQSSILTYEGIYMNNGKRDIQISEEDQKKLGKKRQIWTIKK
ncbi:hypothetical protein QE152_g30612 [Popillia japonica]|uniref:Integrase catalytic domain-containing protein n=1 Tax=Popillia japonica TaxID=7064 RepID=A0AAW1JDR0_POPJA